MRRSGRRASLAAAVLGTTLALAGCQSSSDSASPSATATATPTQSASSTPSPTRSQASTKTPSQSPTKAPQLPTVRVEAADMHVAVLGQNAARTPQERAVVEVWMTYWQGVADTFYDHRPSRGFEQVARSTARSDIVERMRQTRADKERIVGWARDNVTAVEVDGDRATVEDCTKNFTFTVDDEAEPITKPDPYYRVTGTLRRSQGQWTVTAQRSTAVTASCLP